MLDELPTEVLSLIFSKLCLHCQTDRGSTAHDVSFRRDDQQHDDPSWYLKEHQALFSVCLASKRLYGIAQPVLHHAFMPGYGDSRRSSRSTWDGRLTAFMRTMTERRDLASMVRRVYINHYLIERIDLQQAEYAFGHAAAALGIDDYWTPEPFLTTTPGYCVTLQWQQELGGAVVQMLVLLLPNLQHLGLQVNHEFPFREYPAAVAFSAVGNSAGQSLKTLDIALHVKKSKQRMQILLLGKQAQAILKMAQNLSTLNLHMLRTTSNEPTLNVLRNLRVLRVTHSRVSEEGLEALLCSCSNLETFVYEATTLPEMELNSFSHAPVSDHFQPAQAIRHLRSHHRTLKSLHLDLRKFNFPSNCHIRPILSITDFGSLRELFLSYNTIYNKHSKPAMSNADYLPQLLPSNIVSLRLAGTSMRHYEQDHVTGLHSLARAVSSGQFPNLKLIRCDARQRLDGRGLEELFAGAGVDFGYEDMPMKRSYTAAAHCH
ncbi:Uu.00g101150.m01.CDS01 [Anthostomella pinea]|uniref:Uu.00g101150.m01.CDS01 n=1 Tax=Anthostomella pinea TaxID=933095 RepID=A0AAI8VE46_9PEZI|nr:Uu.00g101150.m01.CDS01 [Anthostomella pinea]